MATTKVPLPKSEVKRIIKGKSKVTSFSMRISSGKDGLFARPLDGTCVLDEYGIIHCVFDEPEGGSGPGKSGKDGEPPGGKGGGNKGGDDKPGRGSKGGDKNKNKKKRLKFKLYK